MGYAAGGFFGKMSAFVLVLYILLVIVLLTCF